MLRIFRLVHLPFWRQHPWQALLPALGIAIGVAAILAVDLGSRSTVQTFEDTLHRLAGRTTHVVRPGTKPLDPRLASRLAQVDGVAGAAPVLETIAFYEEPLRVYGIDPLAEADIRDFTTMKQVDAGLSSQSFRLLADPGAVLVSEPFLRRRHIAVGDTLDIAVGSRRREVFVLGALPTEFNGFEVPDNLAVCDISTAQELTGRHDVDRIDLRIAVHPMRPVLREVRHLLGTARLESPRSPAHHVERMLGPLRLNLRALSYLALFVSLFLIYNAMVVAVLRRRATIGILRCLGATPRAVLGAWLIEGLVMGSLGTLLGLLLGILGGRIALGSFASTTTDLHGWVQRARYAVDAHSLARAALVGMGASLLAAFAPALEAARTAPIRSTVRSELESTVSRRVWRRALVASVPLAILVAVALRWPSRDPLLGYAAAIGVAFLAAALSPPLGSGILWRAAPLFQRFGGTVPALAARNIHQSLSRTGIALAALTVALSMSIAMGTMISSFRHELHQWIALAVRADVYISPLTAEVDRENSTLDEGLLRELRQRPEVADMDTYRSLRVRHDGSSAFCAAIQVPVYRRYSEAQTLDGTSPRDFYDRLEQGQAAISETLARRWQVARGDLVQVEGAGHVVELRVAAVYRDYSNDQGLLLMDRRSFEQVFGKRSPQGTALYLHEDVDATAFIAGLKKELGARYAVLIRSNRDLRQRAYDVFERTFRVARGLEIVGIAVAAIGILAALLALLLERGRELATLRTLGLTPSSLRALLLTESIMIAVVAWVFAVLCGSGLSWILLHVINVRSFGWLLPLHVPLGNWMLSLLWSLLAATLATWIPLRLGSSMSVSRALREA